MKVFSGSSHLTLGLTLLQRLWQCINVLELFLVEVEMFTYSLGLSNGGSGVDALVDRAPAGASTVPGGIRAAYTCMVNILGKIGHWGTGEISMVVGLSLSTVHINAVVGLPSSTEDIDAAIGLPCCTVNIKKELGLFEHGNLPEQDRARQVIQKGDYLTADLDISVTIHGMMWGEVE